MLFVNSDHPQDMHDVCVCVCVCVCVLRDTTGVCKQLYRASGCISTTLSEVALLLWEALVGTHTVHVRLMYVQLCVSTCVCGYVCVCTCARMCVYYVCLLSRKVWTTSYVKNQGEK